jgi:uncharacterized protein YndB with AHSA1/START domain
MSRTFLKIAAWLGALLAAFIVLVIFYGAMLPEEHAFLRAVQLAQPPEPVYQTIADLAGHAGWRPDVRGFQPLGVQNGKETWRYTDGQGVLMRVTIEEAHPPKRLLLHYVDEGGIADVRWDLTVGAIPGGCLVSVHERGRISGSFFRGMNKLFGNTKYADSLLRNLARKFGQQAVIQ